MYSKNHTIKIVKFYFTKITDLRTIDTFIDEVYKSLMKSS